MSRPFGIVAGDDGATMSVDDRPYDLKRLGVVDDRAERLTEIMCNGVRERRHGFTPADVRGERQVPPALTFGALPRTALVQEPGDQKRLECQHADGSQHGALYALHRVSAANEPMIVAAARSRLAAVAPGAAYWVACCATLVPNPGTYLGCRTRHERTNACSDGPARHNEQRERLAEGRRRAVARRCECVS
jgi:hypothetical protein